MRSIFLLLFFIHNITYAQSDTLKQIEVSVPSQRIAPKPYTTIDLDSSIQRFESENISSLLNKETSLFIKEYGSGMLSTLSIRGANANHTKLYWNGIPINSPTLGQTDLNVLPVLFVNNISLNQGAGSIVDGSGGIGGSLQLNNIPDWESPTSIYFSKQLGSFGRDRTSFKFNLVKKNFINQSGVYHYQNDNNYYYTDLTDPNKEKVKLSNAYIFQYGGFNNSYFRKGTFTASVKANYTNSFREIPPVIGAISDAWQKDINQRILAEVDKTFKQNYIQLRSGYIKDGLEYNDSISQVNSDVTTTTFANNIFFKHLFTDSLTIEFQSNNYNYSAESSGFSSRKNQQRNQLMGLLQHQTKFVYYTLSAQLMKIDSFYSPGMYSAGIEKQIKRFQFKLNAAKTYNYPTLNDLYWNPGGNKNLKPEEGYNSDLSIEKNFKSRKHSIRGTVFYANTNNLIQWLPQSNGIWSPINLKNVTRKGIEFVARTSFQLKALHFHLKSFYTYVDATNVSSDLKDDASIGKQLIYIPKHKIGSEAVITVNHLSIRYNQQFVSSVFIDATNTTYLPWYAPADLTVAYNFDSEKSFSQIKIGVYNIFNEEYQVVANRPMPMRHFAIQLTVNISGTDNEK